jgi:enterochelin esterase-like enzyme
MRAKLLICIAVLVTCIAARPIPKVVSAGTIETIENFESKFIKPRNVHVWLPEGYSAEMTYPVLYMHDGHMLFDPTNTWNKQEWGVDEVASELIKNGDVRPFIVVGIDSLDDTRYLEYFPQKAQAYAKKSAETIPEAFLEIEFMADNYLQFLVKELKPFIKENYSVSADAKDTALMGSSMGGLISMYALSEYPEEFGMAACISTHFPGWVPEQSSGIGAAILLYMNDSLPNAGNHKIYYDHGTEELDSYYEPYQLQVDQIMRLKGYSESNWLTFRDEGAGHNEASWNKRLHLPMKFLFATDLKE